MHAFLDLTHYWQGGNYLQFRGKNKQLLWPSIMATIQLQGIFSHVLSTPMKNIIKQKNVVLQWLLSLEIKQLCRPSMGLPNSQHMKNCSLPNPLIMMHLCNDS